MVVKLKYSEMHGVLAVKQSNGELRKPNVILKVDSDNILDAIAKFESCVSLFLYEDDIGTFLELRPDSKRVICIKLNFNPDVDNTSILATIPRKYRVILALPENYSNMLILDEICREFQNVRFCGGKVCAIGGIRLGCLSDADDTKQSKNLVFTNTCCCTEKPYDLSEVDYVFNSPSKAIKSDTERKPKAKKTLPSFVSLGGLDSF